MRKRDLTEDRGISGGGGGEIEKGLKKKKRRGGGWDKMGAD